MLILLFSVRKKTLTAHTSLFHFVSVLAENRLEAKVLT